MIFVYEFLILQKSHFFRHYHTYDFYRYRSIHRKNYKELMKINNLVEDHHIIPKQWKDHELLTKVDFDINHSKNIYIMPKKKCKEVFYITNDTLIHQGGHYAYNMYVKRASIEEIIIKTKLDKEQIMETITRKENSQKKVKITQKPKKVSLENEIIEMRNEIKELKNTIKELVEMMKAVYEFEDS